MLETLTSADVAEAIGMLLGSFAVGFFAGRLQRVFTQIGEKL